MSGSNVASGVNGAANTIITPYWRYRLTNMACSIDNIPAARGYRRLQVKLEVN